MGSQQELLDHSEFKTRGSWSRWCPVPGVDSAEFVDVIPAQYSDKLMMTRFPITFCRYSGYHGHMREIGNQSRGPAVAVVSSVGRKALMEWIRNIGTVYREAVNAPIRDLM
jgi:hypothetical protein